jgi:hypothetical protein
MTAGGAMSFAARMSCDAAQARLEGERHDWEGTDPVRATEARNEK